MQALVFESNDFETLVPHVQPGTLVVLDLDDTVMTTVGHLGSQAWVNYMIARLMKKGLDLGDALGITASLQLLFYTQISMVPVEQKIPEIIKDLQNNNVPVIALTSRTLAIEEVTLKQLDSIGVDFSNNTLYQGKIKRGITSLALYADGIIFCTGNDKGQILFQFLDAIGYVPQKIVFVDDQLKNVIKVESAAEQRGIDFVGIHYKRQLAMGVPISPDLFEQELYQFKQKIGWAPLPTA